MVRKLIVSLFFLTLFPFFPVFAEEVLDFDQTININKDSSLDIRETIAYDFGDLEKHGIYREIPYRYEARGGNFKLRIDDVSVQDGAGNDLDFETSKEGNDLRIKIGDADKTISGQQTYVIGYRVRRAINFFADHDELYWNVVGDKWQADIAQSKATLVLPEIVKEEQLKMDCFSGAYGETGSCVSKRFVYENAGEVKQAVFIDDVLPMGRGFTVVLSLPKGLITEPSWFTSLLDIVIDNIILGLPLLVAIALFYLWQRFGRDQAGQGTIVAQFDAPAGLSPMAVGTLVDERADNKDFSANLISLAVKGYLRIVRMPASSWFKKDDYALVFLSGSGTTELPLTRSETALLKALGKKEYAEKDKDRLAEIAKLAELGTVSAAVCLSDLKQKFYKDLTKLKSDIYDELTENGYFRANPQSIRGTFGLVGAVVAFLSLFLAGPFGILAFGAVGLSGLMIFVAGFFMAARTRDGSLAREHILGLKDYLSVAEADRLKFHNAPAKEPRVFEKLLPFAMVLGVEKEWAKQFDGISQAEPDWYRGHSGNAFSALAFSNSLDSFSTASAAAAASTPSRASGGGSGFSGGGSGGGFGGGGGGSW